MISYMYHYRVTSRWPSRSFNEAPAHQIRAMNTRRVQNRSVQYEEKLNTVILNAACVHCSYLMFRRFIKAPAWPPRSDPIVIICTHGLRYDRWASGVRCVQTRSDEWIPEGVVRGSGGGPEGVCSWGRARCKLRLQHVQGGLLRFIEKRKVTKGVRGWGCTVPGGARANTDMWYPQIFEGRIEFSGGGLA
eukprot:1192610-Prorocentrum_minimum.AAC.1